jgi:hypothetical protein
MGKWCLFFRYWHPIPILIRLMRNVGVCLMLIAAFWSFEIAVILTLSHVAAPRRLIVWPVHVRLLRNVRLTLSIWLRGSGLLRWLMLASHGESFLGEKAVHCCIVGIINIKLFKLSFRNCFQSHISLYCLISIIFVQTLLSFLNDFVSSLHLAMTQHYSFSLYLLSSLNSI